MKLSNQNKQYYSTENKLFVYEIRYTILDEYFDKQYYTIFFLGKDINECIWELEGLIPTKIINLEYKVLPFNIDKISSKVINEIKNRYKNEILELIKNELKEKKNNVNNNE